MKKKAKMTQQAVNEDEAILPYLYEFFNVIAYTQLASAGICSILARVLNSLIEALSERP